VKGDLYSAKPSFEEGQSHLELALERMTRKSMYVLRLLCEGGNRSTIMTSQISQVELARKLHVTRQALSVHLKRLSESGLVQIGRGFMNVTEDGLRATGYHSNPAILIVRFTPQKQLEAVEKLRNLARPSYQADPAGIGVLDFPGISIEAADIAPEDHGEGHGRVRI